jgi:integrase/recombinase XerD
MFTHTDSLPDRTRTVAAEAAGFIEAQRMQGRSERTVIVYGRTLARFGRFLEGRGVADVREVEAAHLEAYARQVLRQVSRNSAHLYLRVVRVFFAHLARTHRLLADPAAGMAMPKLHRKRVGPMLTREWIERLMAAPDTARPTGLRDRALLEFLYSTGLRVSEARKIKMTDLDLAEGAAQVHEGKGAKDRVVPVGNVAREWLKRYLEEARPRMAKYNPGHEELFVAQYGKPFGEILFGIHLRGLGRRAGLPFNLTCHVIRRTLATDLLRNGASPQAVANLLGHEDIRSLGYYVAFAAREIQEAHRRAHPREGDPS